MSISDIMPAVQLLSRTEKFQLAQMLIEGLASEEAPSMFKDGQDFPIYTPEYSPNAASQLARILQEDKPQP